ncbi:MAG TPA: SURF1 family protein [Naasia sp.]
MTGLRFLLTARWLRYLLMAVLFAVACAGLANWQLARRAEKVAEITRIQENYDAQPVPLQEALPEGAAFRDGDEWTPVALTGQYAPELQLLVRNRPRGGTPGFEVLVPFRANGYGDLFLIDRGWVPIGETAAEPADVPAAPSGTVSVVVRLKPGEPSVPGATSATGVLASIHLPEVERITGEQFAAAYGLLDSESPAVVERPEPALRPALDEGPHLSYAFQWAVFALIGFGGLAFAVREERRHRNADDPAEKERAARREERRAGRRSDADEEDALLDSSA